MKTILITGGNSMLGLNAIKAFTARGYSVRAMVRHSNVHLESSRAEIVFGNITIVDDIISAAQGCHAIIHIAATTDQNQTKLSYYININVASTIAVCQAATTLSTKRVVLVSTSNTIGNGTFQHLSDETTPPASPFSDNLYAQSKIIAQNEALKSSADVVIVNPTFMFGRYDSKPSSGSLLKMYYNKRLAFVPKGGKNFVAAADVATALVDAMERGVKGQNYIAGGVNLSFKEFLTAFYPAIKRKSLIIELPSFMFIFAGAFGSIARGLGVKTQVSLTNMKILTTREYYTSEKAISELSMPQSDVITAASGCYKWMLENGVIKK